MRRDEIATGLFLLALAAFVVWHSSTLPLGEPMKLGPGFVPLVMGIVLAALGALYTLRALTRGEPDGAAPRWPRGEGRWIPLRLLGALIGYGVLIGLLGYVASTFLFVFVALGILGHYSRRVVAAAALGTTGVLYVVFALWLRLSLPRSPFGLP